MDERQVGNARPSTATSVRMLHTASPGVAASRVCHGAARSRGRIGPGGVVKGVADVVDLEGRLIAQGHKAQNQMETCGRDLAVFAEFVYVLAD